MILTFIGIPCLVPQIGFSETIHVPGQYPTIQEAIEAANTMDIVLVAPGTYKENIDFHRKLITLRSDLDGNPDTYDISPSTTHIDGNRNGSVVVFSRKEGPDCILAGFTITNGTGTKYKGSTRGGGIFCWMDPSLGLIGGSSPTIMDNIITGNEAEYGAGINCYRQSSPLIFRNTISHNISPNIMGMGGGIYCEGISDPNIASPQIISNTIIYNYAYWGGGILGKACESIIENNIIIFNQASRGAGIFLLLGRVYPRISSCTLFGNEAERTGGGLFCGNDVILTVTNTIIWGNSALEAGDEIVLSDTYTPHSILDISYSNVKGGEHFVYMPTSGHLNWGDGMIDEFPGFVDIDNMDFHLSYESPCRDAGINSSVNSFEDIEGDPRFAFGITDMGADEFYPHVYCAGAFEPGGWIKTTLIGIPGTCPTGLIIGSDVLDPPLPTAWGPLFLEAPWTQIPLSPIPSSGYLSMYTNIPATAPLPGKIPLQAYLGEMLSNLFVIDFD